jgi:hypothetical protein
MPTIRTEAIGLFTPDEDAVLARWFAVRWRLTSFQGL